VIGVLVSGQGSNLQALIDAGLPIAAVASNKPGVRALDRAEAAGIDTGVFRLEDYAERAERDAAMAAWLEERGVELVVLAGYMAILDVGFVGRFPDRILNVHPALLPAFPGIRSVERAFDHGVKVFGVTVHLVDEGVDTGPIVLQRAIELPQARTAADVRERLRPIEHELLPHAVALMGAGRVRRDPEHPRRVLIDPAGARTD
jgi:phosphoribosylglycinamide formyltransferase-1